MGIRMADPPRLQLQDFLERPLTTVRTRRGGDFASDVLSHVWMQCRILDMPACIAAMHFCGEPVSFNLKLTDPIEKHVPEDCTWKGVGGNWIITLGEDSSAEQGIDEALPSANCNSQRSFKDLVWCS